MKQFVELPENTPRSLYAALTSAAATSFPLIGELKRTSPLGPPLHKSWGIEGTSSSSSSSSSASSSAAAATSETSYNAAVLAQQLVAGGAAAVAVQTDGKFFGGTAEDLSAVRSAVAVPVLSSEVIVYVYQLYQARLAGADAVRLIAAALPPADLALFHKVALKLGMQVRCTTANTSDILLVHCM
jgi:indole-3-glycerol phosphate synthase